MEKELRFAPAKHTTADRGRDGHRRRGDARILQKSIRPASKARERYLSTESECATMIGSLAEGLAGVVVGEVTQSNRQRQGDGPRYLQQQQQQQHQRQQQSLGPLAGFTESVGEACNRALAMAITVFQYLMIFVALLLSAVVLYGALYWAVMPLRLHDKPLFFDYSLPDKPMFFDYSSRATSGGATATVDFLAQHTQWDPSPLATVERVDRKILRAGQHYLVGLELQMPTSYINRRVGVFMVHTTLLDARGNELATSARPAMLPHTSALRKGIGMFFSWPLHLLGIREEADTVFVSCMDFYQESALHPLAKARVTVSSGRVQFYRASVHITPQLKGLPWLMHDWFYSTLALGVLFITSLELMFYGFYYVFFLALEPDADTSNRRGAPGTGTRSAGSRARTGRFAATNVPDATTIISGARGRSGSSQGGQYVPSATVGSDRGSTGSGGVPAVVGEETLRRRHKAEGGSWGTTEAGRPFVDASRPATTAVSSESSPSSRPGIQAYQRGARYVIEGRGFGQDNTTRTATATAAADVGSAAAGDSAAVDSAGAGAAGGGGGGAAAVSGGGKTGSARVPSMDTLSEEEEHAAAMASWAALGGGVDVREGSALEGRGGGGGSVGGSTIPRAVGPGDEKSVEEHDSGDQGEGGGEEGVGGGMMPGAGSSFGAQALAPAECMGRGEGATGSRVHDLTDQ